MVAHDNVLIKNDGASTPYVAGRVAGAAALVRQKFPDLTGKAVKAILLQTATDLDPKNDDGTRKVDAIYGYGKLACATPSAHKVH